MMIQIKLCKSLEMISILAKMQGKDFWNKFKNKYRWMMTMNDFNPLKCNLMIIIELFEKIQTFLL